MSLYNILLVAIVHVESPSLPPFLACIQMQNKNSGPGTMILDPDPVQGPDLQHYIFQYSLDNMHSQTKIHMPFFFR